MGRQEHLERLALGRSAFEKPDEVESQAPEREVLEDGQKQQYDHKGRPVNPEIERRKELMRDAQNAVLELVGVVEKKDAIDERRLKEYRLLRADLLKDEDDRGELLELVTSFLQVVISWWPLCLISRVQAGIYPASISFADIVLRDVLAVQHSGARAAFDTFLAGAPANFLCFGLKMVICVLYDECIGRLQQWLATRLGPKASKRVKYALDYTSEILHIVLDAAFLPLQYHFEIQRLGLAPARPILPTWSAVWPWSASSMHQILWQPTIGTPLIRWLCSPAVCLLLENFFTREHIETLPLSHFTNTPYPPIDAPAYLVARGPSPRRGFLFQFFASCYFIRVNMMKWFGFNLEMVDKYPEKADLYQNNRLTQAATAEDANQDTASTSTWEEMFVLYRSTVLAHLPAQHLAERLDDLIGRIVTLPFTGIGMRVIAQAFITSSLPKAPEACTAAPNLYSPLGGGPFNILRRSSFSPAGFRDVGNYLSKLGLSLALNCATDISVFYLVYRVVKWQGIRNFYWGDAAGFTRASWTSLRSGSDSLRLLGRSLNAG